MEYQDGSYCARAYLSLYLGPLKTRRTIEYRIFLISNITGKPHPPLTIRSFLWQLACETWVILAKGTHTYNSHTNMSTDQEIIRIGKQLEKTVSEDTPVSPFVYCYAFLSPVCFTLIKAHSIFSFSVLNRMSRWLWICSKHCSAFP